MPLNVIESSIGFYFKVNNFNRQNIGCAPARNRKITVSPCVAINHQYVGVSNGQCGSCYYSKACISGIVAIGFGIKIMTTMSFTSTELVDFSLNTLCAANNSSD